VTISAEDMVGIFTTYYPNISDLKNAILDLTHCLTEYRTLSGIKVIILYDLLFLLNLFLVREEEERNGYCFVIRRERNVEDSHKHDLRFHALCISPAGILKRIFKSTKTVVLTSGSLSPSSDLLVRLGSTFKKFESLAFPIDPRRLVASVLTGIHLNGQDINFVGTSENLSNDLTRQLYIEGLASTITKVALQTKGASLVFFPNYSRLIAVYDALKISIKDKPLQILSEMRESNKTESWIKLVADLSKKGPDLIILAVCRGTLAEGVNLPSKVVKTLCMVGVPYANIGDIHVKKKNEFWLKNENHEQQWLDVDAFCAVNQALGRLLRRNTDYGSIILLDSRYSNTYYMKFLPEWLGIPEARHINEICDNINQIERRFT
jgi:Rad3-related DNA helicase